MKKIISMLLALSMTVGLVFGMTVINSFALEADELDMTDWIAESDSSTSEENWPLSNMFDGELETEWFGKTPVQDGQYHSFTVDMTEIKTFSGVRLYYKQDGNGTYTNGLRQVTLFTKDSEEEDWTAVKTVNYETDADIYEINFGKVVKARYIKYQVEAVNDSGSWWGTVRVQEFRVLAPDYNLAEDEAEITESWSVEAGNLDSWWAGAYPETVATEYVIDGNFGTRWQGFSSGGDMSGQYVVVDMGEATNISGVRAYIPADHIAQAYPLSVTVSVSDNGSDWKEVKSENYTYDENVKELVVDFGKNVEIQYIKYAITSKPAAEGASCIAELRALSAKNSYDDYIYDTLPLFPVADDEIGITSNWSAEGDINEYFTDRTAELTIDGNDTTLWFAPAAQGGKTPSMIVDMGEAKSFSGVRLYYNIDGNGAGLTNGLRSVTVFASDNGDDWTAIKTVTYDSDETTYEIDLGYNIEAQYIKYQINSINDSGSWYGTPMVKEFRALSAKDGYSDETLDTLPLFSVAEDEIAPTRSWSISINATNEWFPDNADANLIMDGNIATQWVGPFVGSNGINDPGAVVNMGEVKTISGVRAYINDFSSYNSYPIKVAVSVSDDGASWTPVKEVTYAYDTTKLVLDVDFGFNIETQYVKYAIIQTIGTGTADAGVTHMAELRMLETKDAYDDITIDTLPLFPVAADEVYVYSTWSVEAGNLDSWWAGAYPETVATEYVIDGNFGTRWQGFSSGGDMSGQYVVVDMGEATNISGVRAYIPADHIAQAYPLSVTVSVSDNGSDWKEVKSENYTYDENVKELVVDFGKNVEIQYIKYAITSKPAAEGASCIAELRALSAKNSYDDYTYDTLPLFPVADDEIGITSDWSAEGDINQYFTDRTATLTIDGSDATLWFAPAAQGGATPSMIVDMGEAKSFSGVRLYYNIDGNGAGLTNGLRSVTVLASDNGDDWTAVKTVTYATDETVYEIDLGYNIEAQYIKYQINSINDSGSWYGTPMVKEFRVLKEKSGYADETLDTLPLFSVAEDEIAPTRSWSISVNSTNEWFPDNADANLIMDGNVATQWVGAFVGSNGINDPGAVVNMGEVKTISGVRAYINDFSSYNSYPIKVAVSVSDDGASWTPVKEVSYAYDTTKLVLDVNFGYDVETQYVKYAIIQTIGTGTADAGVTHMAELRILKPNNFSAALSMQKDAAKKSNNTAIMRFVAFIEELSEGATVESCGIYILPESAFSSEEGSYQNAQIIFTEFSKTPGVGDSFSADLDNIPESAFDTPITAVGFVELPGGVYIYKTLNGADVTVNAIVGSKAN